MHTSRARLAWELTQYRRAGKSCHFKGLCAILQAGSQHADDSMRVLLKDVGSLALCVVRADVEVRSQRGRVMPLWQACAPANQELLVILCALQEGGHAEEICGTQNEER